MLSFNYSLFPKVRVYVSINTKHISSNYQGVSSAIYFHLIRSEINAFKSRTNKSRRSLKRTGRVSWEGRIEYGETECGECKRSGYTADR